MFNIDPMVVTIIGMAGGMIVWGLRLEGRVNGHDSLFIERKEQMDQCFEQVEMKFAERKQNADERQEDIKARLMRIEQKLDNARIAAQLKDIRP